MRDRGHAHAASRQPRTLPAGTEADREDGHGEEREFSRARTRSRRYARSAGAHAAAIGGDIAGSSVCREGARGCRSCGGLWQGAGHPD